MSYHVVEGDAPGKYHTAHAYNVRETTENFDELGKIDVFGDVTVSFKRAGYDEWLGDVPVDGSREDWGFPAENLTDVRVKGEGDYRLVLYPTG